MEHRTADLCFGLKDMTGIPERIDDALALWQSGRRDGAFLSVLIAVAATARKRYPKHSDHQRFEQFLMDSHPTRIMVEYRGQCHLIEHIFYKWLRCQLVHAAEIPPDILFIPDEQPAQMSVRAGGAPDYVLKLSHGWFNHLIHCVIKALENRAVFPDC